MGLRQSEPPLRRSSWAGAVEEPSSKIVLRLRRLLPTRAESHGGPTLAERRDTERRIASGEIPVQRPDAG